MRLRVHPVAVLVFFAAACSIEAPDPGSDTTWVGTITTEGNVTTVVNESGSVWGGTARLVEEASIGVEFGAEEYMFGQVVGVFATDRHIYVVDRQIPVVRVYTLAGEYVRSIGREGQGPGEYRNPGFIMGDDAGRIFLQDHGGRRFNVYSEGGEVLDTWPAPHFVCCSPMVLAPGGLLWVPVRGPDTGRVPDQGVQTHGPNGPTGPMRLARKPEFEQAEIEVDLGGSRPQRLIVPFTPLFTWNIAYSGALVAGASDRYRFEVQSADGATLVVEHYAEATPIDPAEAEWVRRGYVARLRSIASPSWTWDGTGMPATKPAFSDLIPIRGGDIWVTRQGPGERAPDCSDDPLEPGPQVSPLKACWRDTWIIDAFSDEGLYLGEIESSIRFSWAAAETLFVRENMVVAAIEDDAGTIMVKRYRLVLPGEEER